MRYAVLPYLSIPVSPVVLGCSSNCFRYGRECNALLDVAVQSGVTAFDTARGYGNSERILGEWVKSRSLQGKVLVQTKGGLHGLLGNNRINERCIRSDLEKSLTALQTDTIDLYFLHRDNEKMPVGEMITLLNELKKEGKIQAFGASNWKALRVKEANEYALAHGLQPFSVVENQFSLAEIVHWSWIGCKTLTGEKNGADRAWFEESSFPLMAYSPLGGGFLSGYYSAEQIESGKAKLPSFAKSFKSKENIDRLRKAEEVAKSINATVQQVCLAWVLQSGLNSFVVVGNTRPSSLQKSVQAAEITLTKEQLRYLGE